MNHNYTKLFSVLLLVTPSMFLGMQKPGAGQFPGLNPDEIAQMFTMPDEEAEETMSREQAHLLAFFGVDTPEAQANLANMINVLAALNPTTPDELNAALSQMQAGTLQAPARRTGRIVPSIEEVIDAPAIVPNPAVAAINNPAQTERLQAYWNSLHPAVKASVGIGVAIATCSAAKKLYDFVNKRK